MNDTHTGVAAMVPTPLVSAAAGSIPRAAAYICLILTGVLLAGYYRLRSDSLFGCQAEGYSANSFLGYCQTNRYGDFDHGAFWFRLEPEAARSAAAAQILFLGNSRMQYGFSTTATQEWMSRNAGRFYLLGFAYGTRVLFEREMLGRLGAHPRVYVVNLDSFFGPGASEPATLVMSDPAAVSHYRTKQFWQSLHRFICVRFESFCGHSYAIFRARDTGVWTPSGAISANEATSVQEKADLDEIARETSSGREFLNQLGVDPSCVIFTMVPTVDAARPTSAAIAAALKVDFIAPQVDDLLTFDGSHLDRMSAERWSAEFFEAAGPKIRRCLATSPAATAAAAPGAR